MLVATSGDRLAEASVLPALRCVRNLRSSSRAVRVMELLCVRCLYKVSSSAVLPSIEETLEPLTDLMITT